MEPTTGLRERRVRATREEIHQAAIDLFERRGVRATTVAQIADAAGVSSRTFHRYFATKEEAALPGQQQLLEAIAALELTSHEPARVRTEIEAAMAQSMAAEGHRQLEEHLRVAALLATEPLLQALAAAREVALGERLRERLSDHLPDGDALTIRVLSEVLVALWRSSWEHWAVEAAAGRHVDPAAVFEDSRARMQRLV